MRNIFSEKNKSIYQMTTEENKEDRMTAMKWVCYGFCWGVGGFCTLWVAVAVFITIYIGPPTPELPLIDTTVEYEVELDEQPEPIDPPVTIPSKPDEQEWIIVKKLVEK